MEETHVGCFYPWCLPLVMVAAVACSLASVSVTQSSCVYHVVAYQRQCVKDWMYCKALCGALIENMLYKCRPFTHYIYLEILCIKVMNRTGENRKTWWSPALTRNEYDLLPAMMTKVRQRSYRVLMAYLKGLGYTLLWKYPSTELLGTWLEHLLQIHKTQDWLDELPWTPPEPW